MANWLKRAADFISFSSSDPTPVLHLLGGGTSAGVDVNYSSVMGIAAFWRAVEVISDSMVEIPVTVRMPDPDENDKTGVVAENHPLQMLLEYGVNDEMDYTDFVRVSSHQLATYGNSYWEKKYLSDGGIAELIPLEPSQTRPYVTMGRKFYKGTYTNTGAVQGMPATLLAEDVLHIRGMSRTGFYGMSPIDYCREILGLAIAAPKYGANFFAGGGLPFLALLLDESSGGMSDKQIRDMQRRWIRGGSKGGSQGKYNSQTQTTDGIKEGGRDSGENIWEDWVKVAEGVKDIKTLSIPPNESQFLETRIENIRDIARLTGVPPSKLFETSHSTYNNEAEEARSFANDTLKPQATRIAAALTKQVLEPPYKVKFDLSSLLVPPFKERMEGYAVAIERGIYTLPEVRELEGLPALSEEELQKYLPSANMGGNGDQESGNGMGKEGDSGGADSGGDERGRANGLVHVRSSLQ